MAVGPGLDLQRYKTRLSRLVDVEILLAESWVGFSSAERLSEWLPSGPAPGNCDGLEVVTVVMTREIKTGR